VRRARVNSRLVASSMKPRMSSQRRRGGRRRRRFHAEDEVKSSPDGLWARHWRRIWKMSVGMRHNATVQHKATARGDCPEVRSGRIEGKRQRAEGRECSYPAAIRIGCTQALSPAARHTTTAHTASATVITSCGDSVVLCRDEACEPDDGAQRWD
jgi:hypothetical protein